MSPEGLITTGGFFCCLLVLEKQYELQKKGNLQEKISNTMWASSIGPPSLHQLSSKELFFAEHVKLRGTRHREYKQHITIFQMQEDVKVNSAKHPGHSTSFSTEIKSRFSGHPWHVNHLLRSQKHWYQQGPHMVLTQMGHSVKAKVLYIVQRKEVKEKKNMD